MIFDEFNKNHFKTNDFWWIQQQIIEKQMIFDEFKKNNRQTNDF